LAHVISSEFSKPLVDPGKHEPVVVGMLVTQLSILDIDEGTSGAAVVNELGKQGKAGLCARSFVEMPLFKSPTYQMRWLNSEEEYLGPRPDVVETVRGKLRSMAKIRYATLAIHYVF
jgi:hypothetical protein